MSIAIDRSTMRDRDQEQRQGESKEQVERIG